MPNEIPHSVQETLIVFKNNKLYNNLCIKFAIDIRVFPIRTKIQRINRDVKISSFINKLRAKAYTNNDLNTSLNFVEKGKLIKEFKKHYNILN